MIFKHKSIAWLIAQKLEILWWKNHIRRNIQKNYINWKKDYWKNFLSIITKEFIIPPDARILDAGCGPSGIFMIFDQNNVDAVDPLMDKYMKLLPNLSTGNFPTVNFHCSAIERFQSPYLYNFIFCINVINHVQNPEIVLDRLLSLLEMNGCLIITCDVHRYPILCSIFKIIPFDNLHPHQWTFKDLNNRILKKGVVHKSILLKKKRLFNYFLWIIKH